MAHALEPKRPPAGNEGIEGLDGSPVALRRFQPGSDDLTLATILRSRRSVRSFSRHPLSLNQVGQLLDLASAARGRFDTDDDWRASPANPEHKEKSCLGRWKYPYPVGGAHNIHSLYVLARRVSGLLKGSYKYDALAHTLSLTGTAEWTSLVRGLFGGPIWAEEAPLILMIVSSPVLRREYVNSHRLAVLEAGHLLQNLNLAAVHFGWGACEIGSVDCNAAVRTLGLAHHEATPLGAIAIGPTRSP